MLSRPSDGAAGVELTPQQVREAAGRALGDLLGGGKGKALDAATRADMRVFASKHPHLTVKSADLLALLDATEAEE